MKKEILANNVIVYREAIPHYETLLNILEDSNLWEKWYDVGQQIPIAATHGFSFKEFPSKEDFESKIGLWQDVDFFQKNPEMIKTLFWSELEKVFYDVTKDYLDTFPVLDVPSWDRGGVNVLRYDAKESDEVTKEAAGTVNYALPFHTDFHYPEEYKPGLKPTLTVTMYVNDNYEGGDIEYRVFEKDNSKILIDGEKMIDRDTNEVVPGFNYKPQAGDIIIFPSRRPYYHGVKKVTKGKKFFLRTFWMYRQE